ncbi:MAG TPA: penicillin acylase family protein [Candidatus Dormibacteraeota bacterium]|nr:penicillin acylase family protein [Candidatus Dormibacteraeota bacterium]
MKFLLILVVAVAILVAVVAVAYHLIFRRPLPRLEGRVAVVGLDSEVVLTRDQRGIPHIAASSRRDALFGIGFAHAQDRLWQMELHRRMAAGRLSEVVGPRALSVDRLMRRLGLRRVSEAEWQVTHATGDVRQELLAYTAGVNAAIRDRPLPAEFTMLRHHPEPWEPEDTLAVGRLLNYSQAVNWESQLVRMRLLKELGPELTGALDPVLAGTETLALGDLNGAPGVASAEWLEELRAAEDLLGLSSWAPASNSWAVHGSRTTTGDALLANDPHAPIAIPSAWYRVHLRAGAEELAGLTFCGTPYVLFGRNDRVAWGLVNANVSIQDLYVERFNPNNPLQFDDGGTWQDAVRFREVIRVRGETPRVEDVLVTRRGPVISPAVGGTQPPMSLRWVGLDSEVDSIGWVRRLNLAADWRSFRAAVSSCASPALGVTYADRSGNIGYRLSGFVPVRRRGQGRIPARGWDPRDEWGGFISLEEMPELFNPPSGRIVAANQPVAVESCPHPLVAEPAGGFRAARIDEALGERGQVSPEFCAELQGDTRSLAAVRFRELILEAARRFPGGRPEAAIELLRGWDCRVVPDSSAAALYTSVVALLFDRLVGARLSPALRGYLQGEAASQASAEGPFSGRLTAGILRLLAQVVETGLVPGLNGGPEVLWSAIDAAATHQEPAGGQRRFSLSHPLAEAVGALRPVLSRGPFVSPGDSDTVRVGALSGSAPSARLTAAFYRAVYVMGTDSRSGWTHVPGQSGHPASPNYADLVDGWLRARLDPLPFGEAPASGRRLVLEPRRAS